MILVPTNGKYSKEKDDEMERCQGERYVGRFKTIKRERRECLHARGRYWGRGWEGIYRYYKIGGIGG